MAPRFAYIFPMNHTCIYPLLAFEIRIRRYSSRMICASTLDNKDIPKMQTCTPWVEIYVLVTPTFSNGRTTHTSHKCANKHPICQKATRKHTTLPLLAAQSSPWTLEGSHGQPSGGRSGASRAHVSVESRRRTARRGAKKPHQPRCTGPRSFRLAASALYRACRD